MSDFFSSPANFCYIGILLIGIALVGYGLIGVSLDKRKSVLKRITAKEFRYGMLDQLLDRIDFITKTEKVLDKQLAVLDIKYTARYMTKLKLLGALAGVLVSVYLKNWYVVIPMVAIFTNLPVTLIEMRFRKRIALFNEQILEAFQIFITDYTTTKSVQKTIVNICPKLKYPLRGEFERLGRKLNSGESVENCFLDFAERTQNKWTMIFSQMIITYFRNGGEFVEHLLSITKSITNEKILDEQNNTELSSMRMVNLLINALVPVAYLTNYLINPANAKVFTDTPTGKIIMLVVVVGCLVSLYLGKKISEA